MFNNNETSTQKMLTQSKAAIKRIREEIERQYKEWEAGSGEDYERVEELKGRINLLEAEVSQMKNINEELKGALQNQKKCTCLTGIENTALKKHSSEIQNIAKHQVEELLEHLKKAQTRILELEELLNEAKQPKSNAELKDVDAACDIESEDLQRLKKENEVLKQQLQDIPRTSSAIDQDLLNEIQRLKNEKASLESDKLKLEKENENLKTKSQFTKTGSRQSSIQLSAEQGERVKELDNLRQSLEEQIALLKNENESLRNEIENLKNTLKEGSEDQLKASIELLKNENQDLKKSLEDMEKLKKQLAECLDKETELASKAVSSEGNLKKENDELANENAELKAKLQQMQMQEKQLKEELEKELENRTKEKADDSMQDELKNRLQELEKQNKQINEQLENNLKEKSQSAATEESLKKENDEMKSKLQDLDKLNKENSDLKNKLKELENLVQDKSHTASAEESLNKEIEDLKNKLQDLEKSKKELLDTLDKHKNENTDLKGKLQQMENLKEELSKCLDNEKKSKTQISVSEDALKKQNLELKNKLQDIENLKKDLAECLDKGKKGDTTAVSELNKKIEEMEAMKKDLALCLDSEKKSKSELLASEEALKKQNAELKNKLGEIEKLKKELAECLDNEKKGKSEAAATDNALQKQNAELKKKLEDMEKIKKELAECLENEKKAETQAPDDTLEKEITELKKKLDDLEKLKKELAECQERERKARGDADDALKNLEICNNNNAALKKEVESLSSQLAEYLKQGDGDEPGLALDDFDVPNKTKSENEQLRSENEEAKKLAEEVRQLKEQLAQCLEGQSPDDAQASRERGDADLDEMKIEFRSAPMDLEDSDDVTKEELLAEIRRLLKEIEDQKAEYQKTIKMQKEQYDREVKNLKNTNRVSIEKLQNQHDDQVQELESQHDLDVKHLKKELRRSQMSMEKLAAAKNRLSAQTFCVCSEMPKIVPIITTLAADIGIPQKESPYDRPGRWPKPKGTQDNLLNQILFKAIQNGMESLSMDELKMIYADLVKAIAKLKGKVIPSKMKSTTVEDPMTLMEKIEELEHNLHHKQRGANQKVVTLYAAIRAVEKKISDMKNVLEKEKLHNADLKSKITSMERESQILQVERDLMKQQASFQEHQIAKLQTHYESSRMRIKDLETDLTRKKVKKAPGKCSFCNENKEAYDKRFSTSSKKRSTSSPPTSFSGKSPYSVPQIDLPSPSDKKDKTKRTKKGT
ncbi:hypothetical protein WA026_001070 [Henosepilachna vigintioctopunctata]|uniref:Uncharacterized protein n=1 Tax=Henosepilachna vigintioctopunctata TaxID=420089 RepID=A0AAW1V1A3_9CUCU